MKIIPKTVKVLGFLFLPFVLIIFLYFFQLGRVQDQIENQFFSCNEQSLNKISAEEAKKDTSYDPVQHNAIMSELNDECMELKKYSFTGSSDAKFCGTSRIPQCYSKDSLF
jgi:hypothetical protein